MTDNPADAVAGIARALLDAGRQASHSFSRNWGVPVVTPNLRLTQANAEAGSFQANLRDSQITTLWDGTNTFMVFTANVSYIEASGLSDDICVGT